MAINSDNLENHKGNFKAVYGKPDSKAPKKKRFSKLATLFSSSKKKKECK